MALNTAVWERLASYSRSKMIKFYDVAHLAEDDSALSDDTRAQHLGFYIGIISSSGKTLIREGFLRSGLENILTSCDLVLNNIFVKFEAQGISRSAVETSSFYFTIVDGCDYIKNPLDWDESSDGVCFQWGQRYKALYLPYEVNLFSLPKEEIMDQLCSHEGKIISNAWRLPEGLCWKLTCDSFKG